MTTINQWIFRHTVSITHRYVSHLTILPPFFYFHSSSINGFDRFNTLLLTLTWVIFTQSELIMSTIHYKSCPDSPNFRIIRTGFPGGSSGKEPTYQCKRRKTCRFNLWSQENSPEGHDNPLQYSWQPTPVFLTTHFSISWEIPWTEKPDKVSTMTKAT